MEIDWRTVLAYVGAGFVLLIIADGWRRMRRHNQNLKMDIDPSMAEVPEEEPNLSNAELPNGGARVRDSLMLGGHDSLDPLEPSDPLDGSVRESEYAPDDIVDPLDAHVSSSSWQKDYLQAEDGDEMLSAAHVSSSIHSNDSKEVADEPSASNLHVEPELGDLGALYQPNSPIDDMQPVPNESQSPAPEPESTVASDVPLEPLRDVDLGDGIVSAPRVVKAAPQQTVEEAKSEDVTNSVSFKSEPLKPEPIKPASIKPAPSEPETRSSVAESTQPVSREPQTITPDSLNADVTKAQSIVTQSTEAQGTDAHHTPNIGQQVEDKAPAPLAAEPSSTQPTSATEDTSLVRVVDDVIDLDKPLPLEFPNLIDPIEEEEWAQPKPAEKLSKKAAAEPSPYAAILNPVPEAPKPAAPEQQELTVAEPEPEVEQKPNSLVRVSDRPALSQSPDPESVLSLIVWVGEGAPIEGEALERILSACGMCYGDMEIFHRFEDGEDQGAVQFSMANAFKPGTFNLENMHLMSTRGLNFFMSMAEPRDVMNAFECMLGTAETLAKHMGAEVLDENRSVLSQQTKSHYRQRIREFEMQRRIQGAR